ncbi:MAG: fimbria/pilus outer membrane usher protein [Luteimonas sp.]
MPAFLAAQINGKETGKIATLWQRDSQWQAEAQQWKELGLVLTAEEAHRPILSAADLGIEVRVDEVALKVDLVVPVARLPRQVLGDRRSLPKLSDPAPGVLINYSIAGQATKEAQALSLGHEIRTGGRWGMLTTTGQMNWSSTGDAAYIRGQSRWQFDDYQRQVSYQLGDVRSGGASGAWLGGVRVAKDPTLDPYTPTYPVPSIGGVALDAATVDVLANQARVAQHDVQKGAFTIERFPLRPGRNAMDVVVRDAYGREQVITSQQLYFSPQLLRQGLTTWSVAAGRVRQGTSNDYGKPGASLEIARGLSDTWTVSANAQSDGDHHNAIVSARTILGPAGVLDVQLGRSQGEQGTGTYQRVQYSYQGPRMGVSLSHERSDGFWQLSANDTFGLQSKERTQAAVSWSSADRHWRARASAVDMTTTLDGRDQRIAYGQLDLGWQSGRHSLTASALYDLERREPTLAVGYRYNFGRGSLTATARQAPDFSRTSLAGSYHADVAGRLVSMRGEVAEFNGEQQARLSADARLPKGWARMEIQQQSGDTRLSGEFSGAVHLGAGGATWLPHVANGYAVVNVAGVPDVPVRAEGRTVGKTNKAGRLVVADLQALAETTIRIDERALPPGVQLETGQLTVAPRRMSGAQATFKVLAHDARAFVVHRASPIEPGTQVQSETETATVGFDGALYLEHPVPGQRLTLADATGTCSMSLPTPLPSWEAVPTLECQ